jgi:hypothetical protein
MEILNPTKYKIQLYSVTGFDSKSRLCYTSETVANRNSMQYTLITAQGRVYVFFLQTAAEQFQQAYGGVVFSQQVLESTESTKKSNSAIIKT